MTVAPPKIRQRLYLPERRLLNRREFEQLADSSIFPDERLELIAGEMVSKELPMEAAHATGISLSMYALRNVFGDGFLVQGQLPIVLGEHDEPLPDVAVVVGSARDFEDEHPTTALLVLEVSDTSLRMDRNTKAAIYARTGIQDYWILNLTARQMEVHRTPSPMRGRPLGYGYANVTRHSEEESVSPLAIPGADIPVADFLPRRRN